MKKLILSFTAIFVFSTVYFSQTQADLNKEFGEPTKGFYLLDTGIISKVTFGKDGQVKKAQILLDKENIFGQNSLQFISTEKASKFIDTFTKQREKGTLINNITFTSSCNSIQTTIYENVGIGTFLRCSPNKNSIMSINISWKKWKINKKVKSITK